MRILVCVKQVPASDDPMCINASGSWVTNGEAPGRMNRFDEYAVEQALILREQVLGTTVDALTVGPEKCSSVIRRAMGMGADHGIHVLTEDENYVSAMAIASRIAFALKERKYDLVLAGVMSEDMNQSLVGPMLAEMLHMPCVTSSVLIRMDPVRASVYIERELEGGLRQALEISLPALLTVQSGINKPRYPSLTNIMRANRQELEVISASPETPRSEDLLCLSHPDKKRSGLFLEGSRKDKARQLIRIFRERSLLR
jgi:electron transfer flavoprotein beta subunit